MRAIGINARLPSGEYERMIFVPNVKIEHINSNLERPYSTTDMKSRPLLLAYLIHKGFIKEDDPAVKETFPLRTRMLAKKINIAEKLTSLENEVDIHSIPKFNIWLTENPEAAARFHQVMSIAIE